MSRKVRDSTIAILSVAAFAGALALLLFVGRTPRQRPAPVYTVESPAEETTDPAKAAKDQYEMVRRNTPKIDVGTSRERYADESGLSFRAAVVAEIYLDAGDERGYKEWKDIADNHESWAR